jgi:hypothetical protein
VLVRTGGSTYLSDDGDYNTYYYKLSQAWTTISKTWTQNPQTGLDWTPSDIASLEAGVWLWASAWTSPPYTSSWCTQVYVIVQPGSIIFRPIGNGYHVIGRMYPDTGEESYEDVDDSFHDGEGSYILHTTSGGAVPGSGGYATFLINISVSGIAGYIWVEGTSLGLVNEFLHKCLDDGTTTGGTGTAGHIFVEGDNLHYIDSSGNERYFAGTPGSGSGATPGQLWIDGTDLHYIDASGNERYYTPTEV